MFYRHILRKNIKNEYSINTHSHTSKALTTDTLNGLNFPKTDGSSNQLLKTDGSGNLSFTDNISGELINDTSPQLSANLDLNNNDITGTGNINLTGTIQSSSSITCSDLTVNGSTTHLNTSQLTVDDPLIYLAENNNANTIDIGFYGKFDDGSIKYSGLIRDASAGKFKLFETSTEPTTIVSNIVLKDLELNNLDCNSITAGTWSGSNLNKSQIINLTTDLSTITNNISSNDSDISSLNSSVSSMNSSISTNTSSISSNTSSILTNIGNISSNSSKWSIVDSDIVRASGNVGIGTTTPSSKLTVEGSLYLRTGSTDWNLDPVNSNLFRITKIGSSGSEFDIVSAGTYGECQVKIGGSKIMLDADGYSWFNGGNVGIGTNNPIYKLDVNGVLGFSSGDGEKIRLTTVNTGSYIGHSSGWSIDYKAGSSGSSGQTGYHIWFTGNSNDFTERMRMTNTGNVGIGTNNPSERLHIYSGNIRTEDLYTTSFNIEDNVIATHHDTDLILDTAQDLIVKMDSVETARFNNNGVFECNSISVIRPSNQAFIDCSGDVSGSGSMTSGIRVAGAGFREHGFFYIPDSLSANHSKHWLIGTKYADSNDNLGFLFTANHGGAWLQSLTLKSNGNVGIANTDPNQKFKVNTAYCNGSSWYDSSDINLKKDVEDLEYGLKEIDLIRCRRFKWIDNDKKDIGFIAQELEKIIPEAVDGEEGEKAISIKGVVTVLVKAVQQIKAHLKI